MYGCASIQPAHPQNNQELTENHCAFPVAGPESKQHSATAGGCRAGTLYNSRHIFSQLYIWGVRRRACMARAGVVHL